MMTRWSLGHLEQIGYEGVIPLAIALAVVLVGLRFDSRRWQVLSLGEDWARSQGVLPRPVQLRTLAFSALGVSTSVAICGPITLSAFWLRIFVASLYRVNCIIWCSHRQRRVPRD